MDLFERVFVGLCSLDEAVNAECRDDANCGEYNVFNRFHKVLLEIFSVKIFVFLKKVKWYF
jgi:hypothetical protein